MTFAVVFTHEPGTMPPGDGVRVAVGVVVIDGVRVKDGVLVIDGVVVAVGTPISSKY